MGIADILAREKIDEHHMAEWVTFLGFLGLVVGIIIIVIIVLLCRWCCKCFSGNDRGCSECCDDECCEASDCCCSDCCEPEVEFKGFHTIIGTLFPSVATKRLAIMDTIQRKQVEMTPPGDPTSTAVTLSSKNIEEVLLFAEKELKLGWKKRLSVYVYFILMAALVLFWFLVILADNLLYRKTTTCNDINVQNNQFKCYNANNLSEVINCSSLKQDPDKQNKADVICYLVNFNPPMALGIAVGVAQLVYLAVNTGFPIVVTIASKSKYLIITLQFLVLLALLAAVGAGLAGMELKAINWFFYGRIPMRIAMLVLLGASAVAVLFIPWWAVAMDTEDEEFVDVAGTKRK